MSRRIVHELSRSVTYLVQATPPPCHIPISISDRRETFFLLMSDNNRQREVEDILKEYEERYGLRPEND